MVKERLEDFNNRAKAKLIELYSLYIKDTSSEFVQNAAVDVDNEYCNATDAIFDKEILLAIRNVSLIAFGELPIEKAKKILEELQK